MMRAKELKEGKIVEAYFCDAEYAEWRRVQVIHIANGWCESKWKVLVRVRLAESGPGADTWLRRLKHLRECKEQARIPQRERAP